MKFLTLHDAVNVMVTFGEQPQTLRFLNMEARLYDPGYQDSDRAYRSICHSSCMAGLLHQLISNAPDGLAPRWARQHPMTGLAVLDQSLAAEALDFLAQMGSYLLEEYNAAVKIGPKGLSVERSRIVKYPDPRIKVFMPRVHRVAMVESDLIRLLESAGFDLPVNADGTPKPACNAPGEAGLSSPAAERFHDAATADCAPRTGRDESPVAPKSSPITSNAKEAKEDRENRRLARLLELGGDRVRNGVSWKSSGKRGALARLVEEEAAAARPYSDERNVRDDLDAAAERRHVGRTMPKG